MVVARCLVARSRVRWRLCDPSREYSSWSNLASPAAPVKRCVRGQGRGGCCSVGSPQGPPRLGSRTKYGPPGGAWKSPGRPSIAKGRQFFDRRPQLRVDSGPGRGTGSGRSARWGWAAPSSPPLRPPRPAVRAPPAAVRAPRGTPPPGTPPPAAGAAAPSAPAPAPRPPTPRPSPAGAATRVTGRTRLARAPGNESGRAAGVTN
jgi:hypothetical protein